MAGTRIIDRLVVSLELDDSQFKTKIASVKSSMEGFSGAVVASTGRAKTSVAGLLRAYNLSLTESGRLQLKNEALSKTLDSVGTEGKKAAKGLGDAGKAAGQTRMGMYALIGVAYRLNTALGLPALTRMTEEVAKNETQTLRTAEALHINSTELQAWQKVIGLHGGNADTFNAALEKMSANLGKLGTNVRGAKILEQYLGLAGITTSMVQTKDALGVLRLFSEQMGKMSEGRQFLVGQKLGLSREDIVAMREAGPALLDQVQSMRQLAATPEELARMRQLSLEQAKLGLQWERLKQILAAQFLPTIKSFVETLGVYTKFLREHSDVAWAAAKVIIVAVSALALAAAAAAAQILAAGFVAATGLSLMTGGLAIAGIAAAVVALGEMKEQFGGATSASDGYAESVDGVTRAIKGQQKAIKDLAELQKYEAFRKMHESTQKQLDDRASAEEKKSGGFLSGLFKFAKDAASDKVHAAGKVLSGSGNTNDVMSLFTPLGLGTAWAHRHDRTPEAAQYRKLADVFSELSTKEEVNWQRMTGGRFVAGGVGYNPNDPLWQRYQNGGGASGSWAPVSVGGVTINFGNGQALDLSINGEQIHAAVPGKDQTTVPMR